MNENNENKVPEPESSEYHYVRPDQTTGAYSDATYTTAPENGQAYGYNPNRGYTAPEGAGKEKKPRKRLGTGAIVAICLACVVLAGALGVGGTLLLFGSRKEAAEVVAEAVEEAEDALSLGDGAGAAAPTLVTTSTSGANVMSPEEIYALACQQVVGVTTEITYYNIFGQATAAVSGTGFVLTDDGYIMTNYHVIQNAYEGGYDISVLTYDGTEYAADVVGVEADNDVAVLKIDAVGLNAATLGDTNEMKVGQTIYTVGNPLGELSYTMTSGIVSAVDRSIQTDANVTVNMFQIDAAVNEGNSGGPVYNDHGQVIGIVTAKYTSTGVEGLGFAIPVSDAHYVANELITNGYVSGKAYMGIVSTTVSASAAQYYNMIEGAYVYSVEEGSCAETAGLKTGDIVTAVGETAITDRDDLVNAIKKYRAGDTATLTVYRDQDYLSVDITFDEEQPEEPAEAADGQAGGSAASGEIAPGEYYYEYSYGGNPEDFFNEFFGNMR